MNELHPCPFCGGKNIYIDEYDHGAGKRWRVVCLDCMATVDDGCVQQKYRAIEAWNRRTCELITPQQKSKIFELFEKEDAIAEDLSQYAEELHKRVTLAEKVCWAARRYIAHINSPFAVAWDDLIDSLNKWETEVTKSLQNKKNSD